MSWLLTILVGVLTAVACGAAACYLGTLCVDWYRISSFEGGSGYFVVFLTLLGLVIGLILGIVTSRVVAGGASPGFLRAQGLSLAGVAILFCFVTLFCRLGGDVAPKIDGEELDLEVELRCPRGVVPVLQDQSRYLACMLTALGSGNQRRKPMGGELLWKQATEAGGQWTIPCRVSLFTDRSLRTVRLIVNESNDIEFLLPLPARPGKQHLQWSEWRSDRFLQERDKPISGFSYRVRVRLQADVRREAEEAAQLELDRRKREFAALKPDSPLEQWVDFCLDDNLDRDRIAQVLVARIAELPGQFRAKDPERLRGLTNVLSTVQSLPATAAEPLQQAGQVLVERFRAFGTPLSDPDNALLAQLRGVYWVWHQLAARVQGHKMADFHPTMQALLTLAEQRGGDSHEFSALADSIRTDLRQPEQ
ncbi:hypothetical protein [uncultured Paludibaculum sp.]|uniref:hypothetical protein n=1 Tax=uncultured Paludibaculum sp. TaxID=1765020 RepID=UPI002AAAC59D|nr:hypothetical protein [uncultured Paludibaculum sp.]